MTGRCRGVDLRLGGNSVVANAELYRFSNELQDALLRWQPTHRHYKGGAYRLLSHGVHLEAQYEGPTYTLYEGESGALVVRPASEFLGRVEVPVQVTRTVPRYARVDEEQVTGHSHGVDAEVVDSLTASAPLEARTVRVDLSESEAKALYELAAHRREHQSAAAKLGRAIDVALPADREGWRTEEA